jgi:hypothetical protein
MGGFPGCQPSQPQQQVSAFADCLCAVSISRCQRNLESMAAHVHTIAIIVVIEDAMPRLCPLFSPQIALFRASTQNKEPTKETSTPMFRPSAIASMHMMMTLMLSAQKRHATPRTEAAGQNPINLGHVRLLPANAFPCPLPISIMSPCALLAADADGHHLRRHGPSLSRYRQLRYAK